MRSVHACLGRGWRILGGGQAGAAGDGAEYGTVDEERERVNVLLEVW